MTTYGEGRGICDVIIAQLGGARIFSMAFDLHGTCYVTSGHEGLDIPPDEPGVILRVAKALRPRTYVAVTLTPDDTYRVQLFKLSGALDIRVLDDLRGVYADQLREVVERVTGLALSL